MPAYRDMSPEQKKKFNELAIKNSKRYVKRAQEYVLEILRQSSCVDCNEDDPVVLDFDHVDRKEKFRSVAKLIRQGAAIVKLQAEIDKCVVRCANCHRRKTAKELGWFRYQEKSDG